MVAECRRKLGWRHTCNPARVSGSSFPATEGECIDRPQTRGDLDAGRVGRVSAPPRKQQAPTERGICWQGIDYCLQCGKPNPARRSCARAALASCKITRVGGDKVDVLKTVLRPNSARVQSGLRVYGFDADETRRVRRINAADAIVARAAQWVRPAFPCGSHTAISGRPSFAPWAGASLFVHRNLL